MNDALTQSLLLGAFALALVLVGQSVLHLALGSNRSRAQIRWAFVAAASAVAFVLAADAIGHINHGGDSAHSPLVRVLVCALAVLSFPLHSSFAALGLPARELIWRPTAWLILLWNVAACGWAATRFYEVATPRPDELPDVSRPELVLLKEVTGLSDRGRPIPLFRMPGRTADWPAGFRAITPGLKRIEQTVIRRQGPDADSNCHGWVFAGGKYLIDGRGAQTILDDNGYEPCDNPQPGDVIVYRSGRFVAHSGLVSGVLSDGTVIVESKWNLQERFLHRPADQPYSRDFTFYRTCRGSHQIAIRDQSAPGSTPSGTSP